MAGHQLDFSLRYFSGNDWRRAILAVDAQCHEGLANLLPKPEIISFGLVAELDRDERPVGYVLVLDGAISRIAVAPIFRRMGVGAELLRAAKKRSLAHSGVRLHSCRVPDSLLAAHHFFKSQGFLANRPAPGDDCYLFSLARACEKNRREEKSQRTKRPGSHKP